ncbi:MAG: hypothetical protein BHW09_00195 [Clostridium sp. CAG:245_30_32]|nr:MAG: hypothetical protein BHW09_00195 [Clostridium sp. CAG:245_30_32]
MKNIRLFIESNKLDMLKAFSDDSYLYNYIVNNYSELSEDNIFRNPTILKKINNMIYFSKTEITEDDEFVWKETSQNLKNKNVSYYAVVLDPKNGSLFIYNNLKNKIPYIEIDRDTDLFESINKIEKFNKGLEYEEEMEM